MLLRHAQDAVSRLAAQRGVSFQTKVPQEPVMILTDSVMAEQVLVNTLSDVVQRSCGGTIELTLQAKEEQASLSLRCFPTPETASAPMTNLVITQLVDRLGWTARQEKQPDGTQVVTLYMATQGPSVLVIDDNEGLVELLKRYLTNQACRVIAATSGQEGLILAEEAPPDVIVLDVMMPGMHGWEFLQRLRNQPRTADVPVIVCSIINNPELAYSLGASLFLLKPVSRQDILDALHKLDVA
jgi:CheY-like chemotaxis protein